MQIGRIDHVTHVNVNESRDGRNPLSNTALALIVSGVAALYLKIERRGQTNVQDLRDDVCRLKEKSELRKLRLPLRIKLLNRGKPASDLFRLAENPGLRPSQRFGQKTRVAISPGPMQ